MKEKLAKLLRLIDSHREEVKEIVPSEGEYYFKFRGKAFSISKGTTAAFFAYPKWVMPIALLATMSGSEDGAANYIYITDAELRHYLGEPIFNRFYEWINAKSLGADELFADLGID